MIATRSRTLPDAISTAKDTAIADTQLHELIKRYRATRRPVEVSARRLACWQRTVDRATHLLHPYPAKLLPQIPTFFLSSSIFSEPGDVVLDPFGGSGTVALEAALHGRNAFSVDSNPLAALIAAVKLRPPGAEAIPSVRDSIVSAAVALEVCPPAPDVVNLMHWFYPHAIKQLARLRHSIETCCTGDLRAFFQVCLSATVRKVSLADPRLSVPVRLRLDQYQEGHWLYQPTKKRLNALKRTNVYAVFEAVVNANTNRIASFADLVGTGVQAYSAKGDARDLNSLRFAPNDGSGVAVPRRSVDLVITSPPYAGAQKYVRSASLSLGWLGLARSSELPTLERQCIGREHYRKSELGSRRATGIPEADNQIESIRGKNEVRACILSDYLNDMRLVLTEVARVLRPNGRMIVVMGNNTVCGEPFLTAKYVNDIACDLGFRPVLELVDHIASRGLMTSRNRTASVITQEWITVLERR